MSIENITNQNLVPDENIEPKNHVSFDIFRKKIIISSVIILLFFAYNEKIWAQIESLYNSSTEQFAGISTLMSATANNDIDGVKFFSKAGALVINQRNKGGATSLHIACREGNFEITKILVDNGANVNIVDNEGWSPLMRASLAGNKDIVELLLKNGAKAHLLNSLNETALIHATTSRCVECINKIIENGNLIKNVDTVLLKSQIADAFLIARSQENSKSQGVLESFLDYVSRVSPLISKNSINEPENLPIISNQTKISDSKLNKFPKNYILKNQDSEILTPQQEDVYGVLEDPNPRISSNKRNVKDSEIFEQNIPLNNQQYNQVASTKSPIKYKFKSSESAKSLPKNSPEISNIPPNSPKNINKKIKYSPIISEENIVTNKPIIKPKSEAKKFKFKTGKQSLKPQDLNPQINESSNNDYNIEDLQNKAQEAIAPNNKSTLLLKNLDSKKEEKIQPKKPQENLQIEPEETIILIEKKSKNPNKKELNSIDLNSSKIIDESSNELNSSDFENLQVIANEDLDQKPSKNTEFKANQDNKKVFKFKKNNSDLDYKNTQSKDDLTNSTEKKEDLINKNEGENIKKFKLKKSDTGLEKYKLLEEENI
jgi:ankyrin repeat protein